MLYDGVVLIVELSGFVCDAPAKVFITAIKTRSAYFSCSKYKEDWEGRVVFLNENANLRTDYSFRMRVQEEHHLKVRSILEKLPINMISCFPLDYMPFCCLGVMRKLLWAWIPGSFIVRLGRKQINEIFKYLRVISDYITVEFARKSRPLDELARWKATELRLFLFYTGPVV